MSKYKLVLFLFLVLACLSGGYLVGSWADKAYPVYEGIVSFKNNGEWDACKLAMVQKGVVIRRLDIMEISPLIVDFEITLPKKCAFEYGDMHMISREELA